MSRWPRWVRGPRWPHTPRARSPPWPRTGWRGWWCWVSAWAGCWPGHWSAWRNPRWWSDTSIDLPSSRKQLMSDSGRIRLPGNSWVIRAWSTAGRRKRILQQLQCKYFWSPIKYLKPFIPVTQNLETFGQAALSTGQRPDLSGGAPGPGVGGGRVAVHLAVQGHAVPEVPRHRPGVLHYPRPIWREKELNALS